MPVNAQQSSENLDSTRIVLLEPQPSGAHPDAAPLRRIPDTMAERVLVRYGDRVLITDGVESTPGGLTGRTSVPGSLDGLNVTERLGVEAFRLRHSTEWAQAKLARPRQDEDWDMLSCAGAPATTIPGQVPGQQGSPTLIDDAPAPVRAAAGAPPVEGLNDFLEGPVGLAIVIVDGPTAALSFSAGERTKVAAEVQEGLAFLAAANPSAHVSFSTEVHVADITVADDADIAEDTWRDAAMATLGYPSAWSSVAQLAQDVRDRTHSRWGYVLFMTKYSLWHFGYASNDRIVMQYANDGWGVDNIDRVFAHESGHIFGAPDEYASSSCTITGSFGRFGEPNRNCENGNPASVTCLMKANSWAICESTERHFGWGMDRFRAPNPSAPLSITTMKTDSLTVVGADAAGDIRFCSWEGGPTWWQGWTYLLRGRTAPGGHVTAVSRRPGYLDVFTVGTDGRVYTAAFDPSNRWKGWWAVGTVRAPVGAYVGCVSRSRDQLDIFVVDDAGRVLTAAWEPGFTDGWHGWWQIRGGRAAPGAAVSAVSRSTDKLDVFVVGTDGGVYTAAWEPHFTDWWHGWWRIGTAVAPARALVSAVSRSRDKLDVFVTDSSRRILTAAWEPRFTDGWYGWWHLNGGLAEPGSPVHVVSRSTDKLDAFVVGLDGGTYTAAWEPDFTDWWHGWWRLRGGVSGLSGTVAAVSRSRDKLDAVTVGTDRRPYTAAWESTFTDWWHGWWPMGS